MTNRSSRRQNKCNSKPLRYWGGYFCYCFIEKKNRLMHRYYLEITHNVQHQISDLGTQSVSSYPSTSVWRRGVLCYFQLTLQWLLHTGREFKLKKKKTSWFEWAIVKWYNRPLSSSGYCTKYTYQMNITLGKCCPMKSLKIAECAGNSSLSYTVSVYKDRK